MGRKPRFSCLRTSDGRRRLSLSSLGPLNAEFNANQGEAAGSIPFSELGIGNNVNQGQTTRVLSVSRLVPSSNANPGQAAGSFRSHCMQ
ncbi:hypothetical protein Droror1_Dr00009597 [Drosera rotundifolia]